MGAKSHPVFGSIKPSLRRNKTAEQEWKDFLIKKEYVSHTGLFAQYLFMRCLFEGMECSLEIKHYHGDRYFVISLTENGVNK